MLHEAETWTLCVAFCPALSQQRRRRPTMKALMYPVQRAALLVALSLTRDIEPTSELLQNYEQFPIWTLS